MRNGHKLRSVERPAGPECASTLEDAIVEMARSGELKKPARQAIRKLRKQGIPVTFKRGTDIITQHANGREEVVGHVEPVSFKVPDGVRIIKGA